MRSGHLHKNRGEARPYPFAQPYVCICYPSWGMMTRNGTMMTIPHNLSQKVPNLLLLAKRLDHGFGHDNKGLHGNGPFDECVPGCRFYPEEGRIESIEILREYSNYPGWNEIYEIWKRLDKEEA
jgi:hypothetical protein